MPEPESPVRVGMIGAGFIAQVTHLHVLSELPACAVAAVADNRADLRANVAAKYSIPLQFSNVTELLAAPALDAYVVALPRRAMSAALAAILMTGKPVLAEKPMAYTLAQGRQLVAAAEKSGSALAVGFMKRHDPGVTLFRDTLRRIVGNNELGPIAHVAMRDYCATYATAIPPHFRTSVPRPSRYDQWPVLPEGLPEEYQADYEYTLNVASHDINLLRYVFGNTAKAASFRARSKGVQLATLDCGDFDVALELGLVDTGAWEQTIDVYFRRGRLQLLLPSPLARQETARARLERGGQVEELVPPPDKRIWAFKAQAAQFLDVVRGKAEPVADARDALVDLEIIEELWKMVKWSR